MPSSVGVVVLLLLAFAGPAAISGSTGHGPAVAGSHSSGLHPATCSYPTETNASAVNSPVSFNFAVTTGDMILAVELSNGPQFYAGHPIISAPSDGVNTYANLSYAVSPFTHGAYVAVGVFNATATTSATLTFTDAASPYYWTYLVVYDLPPASGAVLTLGASTFEDGSGNLGLPYTSGACALILAPYADWGYTADSFANGALTAPAGWNAEPAVVVRGVVTGSAFDHTSALGASAILALTGGHGDGQGVAISYGQSIPPPPATAPTDLATTVVTTTSVGLAWANPAGESLVDAYVYETVGYGCGAPTVIDLGSPATSYLASGLTVNTPFSFEVAVSNATGEGPPSDCLDVSTIGALAVPPPPTGLVATAASSSEIDLAWAQVRDVLAVAATTPVQAAPYTIGYDPALGELFVTDTGSDNVSVISDATNTVVATVPVGAEPRGVAYDSALGEVFVANWNAATVSVISAATDVVTHTIPVGLNPDWVTYDPARGYLYVLDQTSNNVAVISDATNTVVGYVGVGVNPWTAAYVPASSELYVTNSVSGNVSVISTATDTVVNTIATGGTPIGCTYDPAASEVWFTDYTGDTVNAVDVGTNTVVATVPVGAHPFAALYDPHDGLVYVANTGSNNLSAVSDVTETVAATFLMGTSPIALVYDSGVGGVYVTNSGSDNVSLIGTEPVTANHVYVFQFTACIGAPTAVVALGSPTTGFPDTGLPGNTSFNYSVTVSDAAGESANSSCANATTLIPVPSSGPGGGSIFPLIMLALVAGLITYTVMRGKRGKNDAWERG